jgi:hypothetical protein
MLSTLSSKISEIKTACANCEHDSIAILEMAVNKLADSVDEIVHASEFSPWTVSTQMAVLTGEITMVERFRSFGVMSYPHPDSPDRKSFDLAESLWVDFFVSYDEIALAIVDPGHADRPSMVNTL